MNNLVVFNLKSWLMVSGFIKVFSLYSDLKFSSVFVLFCLSSGFWGLGGHWHQTPCVQRIMQADLWPCAWSWDVQINAGQNAHIWLDLHKTKKHLPWTKNSNCNLLFDLMFLSHTDHYLLSTQRSSLSLRTLSKIRWW